MSDFFTRLAERTLGLAPTIQPMIPSLFAPEPDLPGDMLLEISEESEESIVADNFSGNMASPVLAQDAATQLTYSTQPAQLAHSASRPTQHKVSQPFSTTSPADAINWVPTRQSDSLTTYRETLATRVKAQSSRRGSQRTQPVTPAPSTYTQTPSLAPVDAQTLRMPRRDGEINEATTTFPASSAMPENNEQQMAEAQLTTQAATRHEQSVSRHTLVGILTSNPPSMTSFPQTQQAQAAQLETPSPEPDIQVTIGRVEVRAVTTPPTSARTQQQSVRPPAMSLDEYLRQQERGGRR